MGRKILEEIHPLNLIREVEKWPVLYEKDGPERANLHLKHKMWLEVSKALFDDWDSYTKPIRELKVQELMRKWRNLRDTFKRHVEMEKRSREGHAVGKKKKYVYFKYMLFLLPHLAPVDAQPDEPLPELDRYFAAGPAAPAAGQSSRRKRRLASPPPSPPAPPAPAAAPPTSRPFDEDAIDEDKHFLLSLVPSFKRMSEDEKLTAKMEILKAIRQVKSRGGGERARPAAADALAAPDALKLEFYNVEDADGCHSNDFGDSDHYSD